MFYNMERKHLLRTLTLLSVCNRIAYASFLMFSGCEHICVFRGSDGLGVQHLYCYGSNLYGQTGHPITTPHVPSLAVSMTMGDVFARPLTTMVSVHVGCSYTCVIYADGHATCHGLQHAKWSIALPCTPWLSGDHFFCIRRSDVSLMGDCWGEDDEVLGEYLPSYLASCNAIQQRASTTSTASVANSSSLSSSPTASESESSSSALTPTRTTSSTPTSSSSPTPSYSPSTTPSQSASSEASSSITHSQTLTAAVSASNTSWATLSQSVTWSSSNTITYSSTTSSSSSMTQTQTPSATHTHSTSTTLTSSPSASSPFTQTRTISITATATSTRTITSTRTATRTSTPTSTRTFTPTFTSTSTHSRSRTHTGTPTSTHTRTSTAQPSPTSTRTSSATNSQNVCDPAINLLRSFLSDGVAKVLSITGTASVYNGDLTAGCTSSWVPQGTLCDDPPGRHSRLLSSRTTSTGATWSSNGIGTLIVDIGAWRSFRTFVVFQMFSDGKTTHFSAYRHAQTSATAPPYTDAGWVALVSDRFIGAGAISGTDVTSPSVITLASRVSSRYLRLDVRNDGTHGYASWTELRSVKLFCD